MKTAVLLAVLISLACGFVHGQAQEKVLWTFTGTPDGWGHKSKLVLDNHGNLYGTTLGGGTVLTQECGEESGCGMVYELSPLPDGTWTEKIIYSFCNANNDYTCPDGRVRGVDWLSTSRETCTVRRKAAALMLEAWFSS